MSRSSVGRRAFAVYRRVLAALRRRVAVDARALAAFRVGLGAVLLCDLLLRARHLRAFYTDAGVLPRATLAALDPAFAALSLHALAGSLAFEVALFVLAGGFALAVLVGYHSRLALLGAFVLTVSLQMRDPLVLNGGDILLRHLLFWALFLPVGARWSVDAARATRSRARTRVRVANVATALLLCQLVLVYVVNAVYKHRGTLWTNGEAVRYVFSLKEFTVLLGPALAHHAALLTAVDWTWLALVTCAPLLLVLTGRARGALAACFAAAHLSMLLTMRLGVFPLVAVVALLPFFPARWWARVERAFERSGVRERGTGVARRLDAVLPRVPRPSLPASVPRARAAVLAVLLVVLLVWNAAMVGAVTIPEPGGGHVDAEAHSWSMFAPNPLTVDAWDVVPATLADGSRVDALTGGPVPTTPPDALSARYPSARWRKFDENLRRSKDGRVARNVVGFRCRRWNATHAVGLSRASLVVVEQPTRLDGPEPTRRTTLWNGTCAAATSP